MNFPEPSAELDQIAHRVIEAAFYVHEQLGPGHYESVYENAMMIELRRHRLRVERQVSIPILFRGEVVGTSYLDILVEQELVLELKAVDMLLNIHRAQVISYLQAARLQLGLLINFNVTYLRAGIKRVIWNGDPIDHTRGHTPWR